MPQPDRQAPAAATVPRAAWQRPALWQLDAGLHATLLGLCLPKQRLRAVLDKVFAGRSSLDDAALHRAVVSQCGTRNKVSEALQRELERRHAVLLTKFRAARSGDALWQAWSQASAEGDLSALWAALTHPKCDAELQVRLLHDAQWRCWQAAESARAVLDRLHIVSRQNGELHDGLQRHRQRTLDAHRQAQQEHARQAEDLHALRGDLAAAKAQRAEWQPAAAAGELLVQRAMNERLQQRLLTLENRCAALRAELAARPAAAAAVLAAQPANAAAAASRPIDTPEHSVRLPAALRDRSVLCVGGRAGQLPIYRDIVESRGARFLHHDGGIEDNAHRLQAQLAAADVVICQAGCLNHNAYAHVKAHAKRRGTPCIFLRKPGAAGLSRALAEVLLPSRPAAATHSA